MAMCVFIDHVKYHVSQTYKRGSPANQEVPSATEFTEASVSKLLSTLFCDDRRAPMGHLVSEGNLIGWKTK